MEKKLPGSEILFETKDIALAAYLKISGLNTKKIYAMGKKVIFSFIDIPERKKLVDDYFNGLARVDPLLYKDAMRNLKTYTFNRK